MELGEVKYAPIIAMIANVSLADKQKCLSSGMDYFISKPFSKFEMIDQIKLALNENELNHWRFLKQVN